MPENLLDLVKGYLTPDIINQAAGTVGESAAATQKTLGVAVPTLIGSLSELASTSGGVNRITQMLSDGKFDGSALGNIGSMFGGGVATQAAMGTGKGILQNLLGSHLDSVTDLIARTGGVRPTSAASLLALVAPLIMQIIGKQRASMGSSSSALSAFLGGQSSFLSGLLPAGLASMLGWSSLTSAAGSAASAVGSAASAAGAHVERAAREVVGAVPTPQVRSSWLIPLAFLAALVVVALGYMWSWQGSTTGVKQAAQSVARKMADLQLPGGAKISVPEGSFNFGLATWLASTSDIAVPKRFVFDNLNFETGTTTLTPDSIGTLDSLVAILKAYPPVVVGLEGHTDNTGDPAANQKLSLDRADAVKSQMVSSGIEGSRIATAVLGADKPLASNDSDEGRAKNRRLELVVTKR